MMNDASAKLKHWFEQQGYPPEAAESATENVGYVLASAPEDAGLAATYWQQCLEALLGADAAHGRVVAFDAFADAVERAGYLPSDVRERIRSYRAPAQHV